MIAQIQTVPGDVVKDVLMILGWIFGLVMMVWTKVKPGRMKIEDQPLDVSVSGPVEVHKGEMFVTKAMCIQLNEATGHRLTKVEGDIGRLAEELKHDREQGEIAARTRSAGIYGKIDGVRQELAEQVGALRNEMGQQFRDTERALGRIEGKIDGRS